MIFPLEELVRYEKNMYEITCASSRRAYQLAMLKMNEEDEGGKIVSIAARQVFTGEVGFSIGTDENAPATGLVPAAQA